MAKHDQTVARQAMVCENCRLSACSVCVDVLRSRYTHGRLCGCGLGGHRHEVNVAIEQDQERRKLDF